MGDVDYRIEVEQNGSSVATLLEQRLTDALKQNVPPNDYRDLAIVARDEAATLIAGLLGGTSYGWLLIKVLWVAELARGHGLGAALVRRAEREAQARGCHGAWLDTSSTRAARFYERLGYAQFGVLENHPGELPAGHRRVFMSRRFDV